MKEKAESQKKKKTPKKLYDYFRNKARFTVIFLEEKGSSYDFCMCRSARTLDPCAPAWRARVIQTTAGQDDWPQTRTRVLGDQPGRSPADRTQVTACAFWILREANLMTTNNLAAPSSGQNSLLPPSNRAATSTHNTRLRLAVSLRLHAPPVLQNPVSYNDLRSQNRTRPFDELFWCSLD